MKTNIQSCIVLGFVLIQNLTFSLLLPSTWANAQVIECIPRTDHTPYCQPKSYAQSNSSTQITNKILNTSIDNQITQRKLSTLQYPYLRKISNSIQDINPSLTTQSLLNSNKNTNNNLVYSISNAYTIQPPLSKNVSSLTIINLIGYNSDKSQNNISSIPSNTQILNNKTQRNNSSNSTYQLNLQSVQQQTQQNILNNTNYTRQSTYPLITSPTTNLSLSNQIQSNNINTTNNNYLSSLTNISTPIQIQLPTQIPPQPQIIPNITNNITQSPLLANTSAFDFSNIIITDVAPITIQQPLNLSQTISSSFLSSNRLSQNIETTNLPNPISVPISRITPQIINQNSQTSNPIIFAGQTSSLLTGGVDVSNLLNTINPSSPMGIGMVRYNFPRDSSLFPYSIFKQSLQKKIQTRISSRF